MFRRDMGRLTKRVSLILICLAVLFMSGCSLFGGDNKPKTYSIDGYVYIDGEVASGAEINCGGLVVVTDDTGHYECAGLDRAVQVTVSKNGVYFGGDLVYVYTDASDVNFTGYTIFEIGGITKNGAQVVPYARVKATSVLGEYETVSNEFGVFYLPRLAGSVQVVAYKDGINFFTQTIDKTAHEVVVDSQTRITGRIVADDDFAIDDFTLMLDDTECEINADGSFVMTGVELGACVTLSSDLFYIADVNREIETVNDYLVFQAYKYYSATGRVLSGETPLADAEIMVGDRAIENIDGTFQIDDLYGEQSISTILNGYTFADAIVSKDNNDIVIQGTFAISGVLEYDVAGNALVYVDGVAVDLDRNRFTYNDAHLGSIITIDNAAYHIDGEMVVDGMSEKTFHLYKLYDVNITLSGNTDGLNATIDGNSVDIVDGYIWVPGVYGEHTLAFTQAGYHYDEVHLNSANGTMTVSGKRLYNLSIKVVSGERNLTDAHVTIAGDDNVVNDNAVFTLVNIYDSGRAIITCDGYNTREITFSGDNNDIIVDLDYDVVGTITIAGNPVNGVTITVGEASMVTGRNGKFAISHLTGAHTISFTKEYYTFASVNVSASATLDISGTYRVSGTLTNGLGGIAGMSVSLLNTDTMDIVSVQTDGNGVYEFTGLGGEYILYYDESAHITLKPNCYDISTGGVYNFSDTGYGFAGRITCGDVGVPDVMLVAGDVRAYTDEDGYYRFDLIVSDAILSISKTGYVFAGNGLAVDGEYDGREDVNFTCTYSIAGRITMGGNAMSGVEISTQGQTTTTDEFGCYTFDSLVGAGEIEINHAGYIFDGVLTYTEHCTLDYSAYFNQSLHIVSGNLDVSGVEICCGEQVIASDAQGMANLTHVTSGDTITFSKSGYSINSITLDDVSDTILVQTTYTLQGVVTSISPIANVVVGYGANSTTTDAQGRFTISGISGSITLTFVKSGFAFNDVVIAGETSVIITAQYSVSGTIVVGTHALSGVTVTAGTRVTTTDENGLFQFDGLSTATNITFAKTGYTFTPSSVNVNSPEVLNISAYYSISGRTMSGNIVVDVVQVTLSNGDYVYTDNDGYYTFNSVSDVVNITFTKSGYDTQVINNVTGYRNDCNANMTYSVDITFTGISDYTGLNVGVNGVNSTATGSPYTISNLSGENTITFSKTDYLFTPSSYIVSGHISIPVSATLVYTVSGTFKTSSGIAIPGATITAGTLSTTTDGNGAYTLTGLNTSARLVATMSTTSNTITKETNVSSTCTYNFTASDYEYAYFMWCRGYDYLRASRYYEIYGKGSVVAHPPLVGDQTQTVTLIYKKDLNYRIFKNQNHGSVTMGVDPRVALLTAININNGQDGVFRYQRKSGGDVSTNTASFDTNWSTDKTKASFLSDNGIDSDSFYPYTINSNTIKSITNLVKTSTGYTFKMTLDHNKAETTASYKKQMYYMCSDQTCKSFSKIELKYEINNSGFIKQMDISETYTVTAKGFDVSTDGDISYYFYTTYMDQPITPIDLSTASTIANAVAMPTLPNTKISYISPTDLYIYDDRRYVL